MDKGFGEVKGVSRDLRSEMNARFEGMQRTMVIGFATINGTVVGGLLAARL